MTDVLFLPGIIAPAAVRYSAFLTHLPDVNAVVKDLEVYATDEPPADYSIENEIRGIEEAADKAGLERFHLYGHSGGGACALAFVAAQPGRVISLAVDEPATDFSEEDAADPAQRDLDAAMGLPEDEAAAAFLRLQLAEGVEVPAPLQGPLPPFMSNRPAGIRAFVNAIKGYRVPAADYGRFDRPVLFTLGTLSHPRWAAMRDRLATRFPNFTSETFEGVHHLFTSHQAEPARTASLLREFWDKAES
jgi:pimeloyl-ACP methyl ester carboxylesterase